MGSKTRLSSYCTKRANNGVNLVTSRKINTRLARSIMISVNVLKIKWTSVKYCIFQFLKKYSDVFILNPDSNWVSLKTHVAPKAVDTSLLTPTVSDLIENPKSNTDVRDNSR